MEQTLGSPKPGLESRLTHTPGDLIPDPQAHALTLAAMILKASEGYEVGTVRAHREQWAIVIAALKAYAVPSETVPNKAVQAGVKEQGDLRPDHSHDKQETPRTDALMREQAKEFAHPLALTGKMMLLPPAPALYDLARKLERELAEANARCERMLDAEQERLLLASEDEIRKEILADGRDPAEYLKAVDKVMKLTGENALLKHDLQKALANHSADLSARGDIQETLRDALAYINHVGSSHVMRGQPHPQEWLVKKLEVAISQYVGEKK